MIIAPDQYSAASGSYVQDEQGQLWQIVGFIERPAVILDPIPAEPAPGELGRQRQTIVMGSPLSEKFTRLVPEKAHG